MADRASSAKHKRHHDKEKDSEYRSKKRHKYGDSEHDSERRSKKRSSKGKDKLNIIDDDPDEDMWVEKNIDINGENPRTTDIPTAESLKLTSHATSVDGDPALPPSRATETTLKRDEWMMMPPSAVTVPTPDDRAPTSVLASRVRDSMEEESLTEGYGDQAVNSRSVGGGVDFFSSLGTERKRKEKEKPADKPQFSERELNRELVEGTSYNRPQSTPKTVVLGGPGSQWRMKKLQRVYETAKEDGKPVEEVALERYGSLEAFEEAKEERRVLDERDQRRNGSSGRSRVGGSDDPEKDEFGRDIRRRDDEPERQSREERLMFTDFTGSGGSSRSSSFRRPGGSVPTTPSPGPSTATPLGNKRIDALKLPTQATRSPLSMSHTPIPSVMTPPARPRDDGKKALSQTELNKLQAKVLRAKLMGSPDAEKLEKEYEEESRRASSGYVDAGSNNEPERDSRGRKIEKKVEVLPTLDSRGRLYDIGSGGANDSPLPGNRRKKDKFETRDPKTGDIVRYNADDDSVTLGEMLRQERFGAGMADQKNLDAEMAAAITRDGKFEDDLEYMDDNAERLGRKKMRSDAMKRQFAINDFKKTQKVMASCQFCYGEDDSLPKAAVIAMATRCYLACPLVQDLVDGHCYIVPIQHHLSMLEGDDDLWDEVRNFMKCLMRMFAEEDQGVVFYETVINIRWQKHTYIECVPLPWDQFEHVPAYFKASDFHLLESILASETEWTQHKKLIDFSARPGGFRRAMVPNLPYFMVQFDHKGEKGYGHVIEGTSDAAGAGEGDGAVDEGEKGGGEFPPYFAAEILGNMLDIEPRRWRRPKRVDLRHNKERAAKFRQKYDKFDWTPMIGKS
ncbi:hypothetical protein SCHPADRAFT_821751 [Schizopora paradoxa]|uniref:CwfJ C-terminus 1-domain-containing protein-like protein n=1 Tax=Schizopora paradoxa TaxID=27342 RepID=A0A0H2SJI1_9AGAM|nr:hypothetical protein SCHPADRAFT_821751 [Schizopora paradoxa]